MSVSLRVFLIVISVVCLFYMLWKIRKSKLQIEYALFWIFCSGFFVVMAIFPQLVIWMSGIMGLQSPANFVFLVIIGLLLLKVFMMTIELSNLEKKMNDLAQCIALNQYEDQEKDWNNTYEK